MASKGNVSVGKPRVAGAVYWAPYGTDITDLSDLDSSPTVYGFTSLGYISEDGVVWSYGSDGDVIRAWGGDIVDEPEGSVEDVAKFTLLETINAEALEAFWGNAEAVTGGYAVSIGVPSPVRYSWCIDMIIPWRRTSPNELMYRDGVRRIVIESAAVGDRDDITYSDDELVAYGVTLQADKASNGRYHREFVRVPKTTLEIIKQPPASVEIYEGDTTYTFGEHGDEGFCSISGSASVQLQKLQGGGSTWIDITPIAPPTPPTTLEFTLPIGDGQNEIQPGDALRLRIADSGNVFYSDVCNIVAASED